MTIQELIKDLSIVYQTPKIEFYLDEIHKLLISYDKNFSNDEEYRLNMQKCLEVCESNQLRYILFESTKFAGTSPANQHWIVEHFIPNLVRIQIKRVSLVMPKEIFGKFTMDNLIMKGLEVGKFEIGSYDNLDEAYDWILEQVNIPSFQNEG